jgi:hypothetical protein
MKRWICALLVGAVMVAAPSIAWTQQAPEEQPAKKSKRPRAQQPPPQIEEEDQLAPRQLEQRAPGRSKKATEAPEQDQPADAQPAPPRQASRAIACSGVFGKESSHLRLAQNFDSRNITFTEVDGPEGSKLMASVLFPRDPKRRLEVLWNNEGARSDTHLIVINGQSTWTAPKGVRLGLGLVALEKLNGKPFKLNGFDNDSAGQVTDWQDGALTKIPGGCQVGIRLAPDPKGPQAARSEVSGNKAFLSTDANMRAVAPKVVEIILGYSQ